MTKRYRGEQRREGDTVWITFVFEDRESVEEAAQDQLFNASVCRAKYHIQVRDSERDIVLWHQVA